MRIGKQMQFFGARANLAKALMYAINGGRDELTGEQVTDRYEPITSEYLDFDEVMEKFQVTMRHLARVYMNALYCIHYMHDKYDYERIEMALMDEEMKRTTACGIAGLSVVADSLSAIRYARVKPIRDENGMAVDFEIEGDFPKYGNNDDRVDELAQWAVSYFMDALRQQQTYRRSIATQSVLTITSNVVYGKNTGSTPDGRKRGEPLAPAPTPCTAATATAPLLRCLPWPKSLRGRPGRYFLHVHHCPSGSGQDQGRPGGQPVRPAGWLRRKGRPPYQRERPQPRNAA